MRIYKNTLGKIYGDLEVIEELGGGKIKCKCVNCGDVSEYYKYKVTVMGVTCYCCKYGVPHAELGERIKKGVKHEGEILGDFKIIKEKGGGYMQVMCVKCGHKTTRKYAQLKKGIVKCPACTGRSRSPEEWIAEIERRIKIELMRREYKDAEEHDIVECSFPANEKEYEEIQEAIKDYGDKYYCEMEGTKVYVNREVGKRFGGCIAAGENSADESITQNTYCRV